MHIADQIKLQRPAGQELVVERNGVVRFSPPEIDTSAAVEITQSLGQFIGGGIPRPNTVSFKRAATLLGHLTQRPVSVFLQGVDGYRAVYARVDADKAGHPTYTGIGLRADGIVEEVEWFGTSFIPVSDPRFLESAVFTPPMRSIREQEQLQERTLLGSRLESCVGWVLNQALQDLGVEPVRRRPHTGRIMKVADAVTQLLPEYRVYEIQARQFMDSLDQEALSIAQRSRTAFEGYNYLAGSNHLHRWRRQAFAIYPDIIGPLFINRDQWAHELWRQVESDIDQGRPPMTHALRDAPPWVIRHFHRRDNVLSLELESVSDLCNLVRSMVIVGPDRRPATSGEHNFLIGNGWTSASSESLLRLIRRGPPGMMADFAGYSSLWQHWTDYFHSLVRLTQLDGSELEQLINAAPFERVMHSLESYTGMINDLAQARVIAEAGGAVCAQGLLKHEMLIDGIEFKELLSPGDLYDEGRELDHCVAGYVARVLSNQSRIFSLQGDGRSTLELIRGGPGQEVTINQHSTHQNVKPTVEHALAASRLTFRINQDLNQPEESRQWVSTWPTPTVPQAGDFDMESLEDWARGYYGKDLLTHLAAYLPCPVDRIVEAQQLSNREPAMALD